jgi:beta-glucosidase
MGMITFPQNFLWGASTASYQIEGAASENGKGESIWDRFSHTPGNISDGSNGDLACNHYHNLEQDVKLMKKLGLKAYRFSISWCRIFPEGYGKPNKEGINFYKRLVKLLLENDIKPIVTLYHWDLPQKLQDIGGWANRQVADYYEEYARYVFSELGALVPIWITHNEPACVSFLGNWSGIHAPGITDFSTALLVSHNLLLSHGKAVKAYREMGFKGEIGITLCMNYMYPASQSENDISAAKRADQYWNTWFSDAVLKGEYPAEILKWYKSRVVIPEISTKDMRIISAPIDFIGINNYCASAVSEDKTIWPIEFKENAIGEDTTDLGFGINPDGLYDLLVKLNSDYNGVKIYITENGAAFKDIVNRKGEIEDDYRLDYLYKYLSAAHRAILDGVNLKGYIIWSLMDNFEWSFGFTKRFGIIYTDYKTEKRIIKKSGYWYRDVIRQNGFEII